MNVKLKTGIIGVLLITFAALMVFIFLKSIVVAKYIKTDNYSRNIEYNGVVYYPVEIEAASLCTYGRDRNLGFIDNLMGDVIYSLLYDTNLDFLYVPQLMDGQLYSKINSKITTGKVITAIYFGAAEHRVTDKKDIDFLLSLKDLSGTPYSYKLLSSGRFAESIFIAYDDCAIATAGLGYIAHIDEKWVYVPEDGITTEMCNGIIINDKNIVDEIIRITKDIDCLD